MREELLCLGDFRVYQLFSALEDVAILCWLTWYGAVSVLHLDGDSSAVASKASPGFWSWMRPEELLKPRSVSPGFLWVCSDFLTEVQMKGYLTVKLKQWQQGW